MGRGALPSFMRWPYGLSCEWPATGPVGWSARSRRTTRPIGCVAVAAAGMRRCSTPRPTMDATSRSAGLAVVRQREDCERIARERGWTIALGLDVGVSGDRGSDHGDDLRGSALVAPVATRHDEGAPSGLLIRSVSGSAHAAAHSARRRWSASIRAPPRRIDTSRGHKILAKIRFGTCHTTLVRGGGPRSQHRREGMSRSRGSPP
jgi:hypothetical protein